MAVTDGDRIPEKRMSNYESVDASGKPYLTGKKSIGFPRTISLLVGLAGFSAGVGVYDAMKSSSQVVSEVSNVELRTDYLQTDSPLWGTKYTQSFYSEGGMEMRREPITQEEFEAAVRRSSQDD